ncbi:SRPBCC domain-containing protein [Streptomyces sp. NPDC057616]|uniref:SRPBCC domain-containing protein n=1 Tax=Streptomyces sp. NPDC057616 TaxID=3346183 RepID=UPI0036B1CB8B
MEHEVFVPVPVQRLQEALADPAGLARAVPGLQQDAGAEPVTGRLKVRVGSHSVTYRGTVRLTPRDDGSYTAEGDGTETRGSGSVKLALTLRAEEAEGGSRLVFGGTASAEGRLTELPAEQVASAATRLLNRFAENLAAQAAQAAERAAGAEAAEEPEPLVTQDFEPKATSDFETTPDADDAPAPGDRTPSVFDTEVPPPSLDPLAQEEDETGEDGSGEDESGQEDTTGADGNAVAPASGSGPEDFTDASRPPAEAAHARRTMIGRSAEEVDHAPPRGRYAPVPAPQTVSGGSPLRWAVPAAGVVLASAIVVGRVLRKRR